jgi:hypothetical protein
MSFVDFIKAILYPPAPPDYNAYYGDLLSTAGVLFGLAFAGLLFVIQSGFVSFKFSRRMFLEVYVHFGRGLLVSLAYLTVLPIAILHFPFYSRFFTFLYYIFAILYAKAVLDHYRQLGYIHTLMSTAFVPSSFGRVRKYFRYIWNLGRSAVFVLILILVVILGYPVIVSVAESGSWTITQKGFFYSSILILFHVALRITNFIPEFFKLSNQEFDSAHEPSTARPDDKVSIDYVVEKIALKTFLLDHGVSELDRQTPKTFLDGEISLDFLTDRDGGEAWFNARISVTNPTNVDVHDEVCQYAIRMFDLFAQSQVDINQFVISFHIKITGDRKPRNMFFRTTRAELETVLLHKADAVKAATSLDNILFDDLFRNL